MSGTPGSAARRRPTTTIRNDIADTIRLIRYVEERRASRAAAGHATPELDQLLEVLRRALRCQWPLRACGVLLAAGLCLPPRDLPRQRR